MNTDELKQKALDYIHLKDLEIGYWWSENDNTIADVLSEFAEHYATSQTEALKKEIEELKKERFKKPETKQLIDMAVLFNDGVLDKEKLTYMLAYAELIIDRLHENGDIRIPSRFEN